MSMCYSKVDHILTETILKDLADTKREVLQLESEIDSRKAFISKLEALLAYRDSKKEEI